MLLCFMLSNIMPTFSPSSSLQRTFDQPAPCLLCVTPNVTKRCPLWALQSYGDDDYLIFDCPGQIELYSHATVFRTFVDWMRGQGWSMCAVYCLDCQFVSETPKFIAGSLQALAAMVQLELPHVNVLTKVDMVADKVCFPRFLLKHH